MVVKGVKQTGTFELKTEELGHTSRIDGRQKNPSPKPKGKDAAHGNFSARGKATAGRKGSAWEKKRINRNSAEEKLT